MRINLNSIVIFNGFLFAHSVTALNDSSLRKNRSLVEHEDVNLNDESSLHENNSGVLTYPLLPHYVVHERRRRELGEESVPNEESEHGHPLGVLYQGYGTHYVDLWVGSPNPVRQTVIVDTGSSITAFPCEGCQDCGQGHHIDSFFPFTKSESFEPLGCGQCTSGYCGSIRGKSPVDDKKRCKLSMSYQEGSSWDAFESQDIVYFGGPHSDPLPGRRLDSDLSKKAQEDSVPSLDTRQLQEEEGGKEKDPETVEEKEMSEVDAMFQKDEIASHAREFSFPLKFGCQYSITGLFKTQLADGIMGMENNPNAFWKQMYAAKVIKDPKFALCFSKANRAQKSGTVAGAITLGGTNTKLHKSPMVYAQNMKRQGWYTVHIRAIYLKSNTEENVVKKLDVQYESMNSAGVIIDSGTTDSYLPSFLKKPFKDAFNEVSKTSFGSGVFALSKEEVEKFPSILVQLKGAEKVDESELKNQDGSSFVGLANGLDSANPNDVVMEIRPIHYFEFLRSREKWESRFHLTESSGGVLGANAIAGHDILFDTDKQRIGIAQSDCDYSQLGTKVNS